MKQKPYGQEFNALFTKDTLISSVMAFHSLNFAEAHSLISSYLDKFDNLHFNGDYLKMLICFHVVKKMEWLRKQSFLCENYPLGKLSKKKADTPLRERMPAFLPSLLYNTAKVQKNIKLQNHFSVADCAYRTTLTKSSKNRLDKLIACSTKKTDVEKSASVFRRMCAETGECFMPAIW